MASTEPTRVEIALVKTARAVRRAFNERLAEIELTMSEGALLSYVDDHGEMTQRELADLLHISRASTGAIIDSLAKRGLVVRSADAGDRRVWRIGLTRAGDRRVSDFRVIDGLLRSQLREGFDRTERHQLADLLRRLEDNAVRAVAQPEVHANG